MGQKIYFYCSTPASVLDSGCDLMIPPIQGRPV